MSQGSELVSELIDKGIRVYILNIGVLDDTLASKLIRNVFFALAEFERDMIGERTSEWKAIAKQNPDFKEGRPKKYSKKQVEHAIGLLGNHSYKQVEDLTGISKSTLMFPSGKFDTNELVLELAMYAYNILRMIGDESIGPSHPMRHPVKRRRIGTVIKNLVMTACHITKHAHKTKLGLGRSNIWRKTFQKVYLSFSCL